MRPFLISETGHGSQHFLQPGTHESWDDELICGRACQDREIPKNTCVERGACPRSAQNLSEIRPQDSIDFHHLWNVG